MTDMQVCIQNDEKLINYDTSVNVDKYVDYVDKI